MCIERGLDVHVHAQFHWNIQVSYAQYMFKDEVSMPNLRHLPPEVIKLFSCSTQLNTKFVLLINVKMPTIVGILTFISRINSTSERLKARNLFICQYFSFYEQLKFRAKLS